MATFMFYTRSTTSTHGSRHPTGTTWRSLRGYNDQTFVDPRREPRRMLIDIPDDLVPAFQQMAQSEDALERGKADSVRWTPW